MASPSTTTVNADTVQNQVFRDQHVGYQVFNTPTDTSQSLVQDCLRSLAYPTMNDRSNAVKIATGGTCKWLLGHGRWKSWISSHRDLLWIKGKPGSGKSTLLHFALREVKSSSAAKHGLIMSFFFHGRGDGLQKSPLGLFRSLLHQLLSEMPDALGNLVNTFQQRRDGIGKPGAAWDWELDELQNVFKCSIADVLKGRPVWIFVDALDESGAENAKLAIRHFKDILQGPSSRSSLHICFSCRHYPVQNWESGFEIHAEKENREDILTYVRAQFSGYNNPVLKGLPDRIALSSNGLFIWARLVVDQILDLDLEGSPATAARMIHAIIERLPQDLNEMYSGIVKEISRTPEAIKLMQLMSCAERPLHLDEIRWAIALNIDPLPTSLEEVKKSPEYIENDEKLEKRLRILTHGLAETISSSTARTVQFIHQSVKDFFNTGPAMPMTMWPRWRITNMEFGHQHIYSLCVKYMLMEEWVRLQDPDLHPPDDFPDAPSEKLLSDFPLFSYVSTYWIVHLEKSLPLLAVGSDWPSSKFLEHWTKAYYAVFGNSRERPPLQINLVHMLARHGLDIPLNKFLAGPGIFYINSVDVYGRTPLLYAAERGHVHTAEILLKEGANANIQDHSGATPLHWAVLRGHTRTFSLLIRGGANPGLRDKGGCTALEWGIEGAQSTSSISCVKTLLQNTPNLSQNLNYEYRLIWTGIKYSAYELGMPPISGYEFFGVDSGSKLFAHPYQTRKHLSIAWMPQEKPCKIWTSRNHSSPVVEAINRYVKQDEYPMMRDGSNRIGQVHVDRTPLLRAVELGNIAIAKMLLANGADPTFECSNGWSPIRLANARRYSTDKVFLEFLGREYGEEEDTIRRLIEATKKAVFSLVYF
ncbi:ankyrin repeat-containing protein [Fusarium subglutinans]|uniref:Ankyrin repeat-containing protein n=1 Tax=Gibberella subglutinans TaxID=42677 RepID=A0A8H5KZ37_GIBSU|nr:ankyrin repeat-containing protein [Fusarium subglutinans]KAF5583304.1 ankyrin repeat-containing protein [Fusarium subglutinans]